MSGARAHDWRSLSVGEMSVLAAIAERGRRHPSRFVRPPRGRGREAYGLYRRGYLQRIRFKTPDGTATRYRINPLLIDWGAVQAKGKALRPLPEGGKEPGLHSCQAVGCPDEIKPPALMCGRHWQLVNEGLRRDIEQQTPADHAWSAPLTPARALALRPLIRLADAAILRVAQAEEKRGPVL
jgi:hypothetical protein